MKSVTIFGHADRGKKNLLINTLFNHNNYFIKYNRTQT